MRIFRTVAIIAAVVMVFGMVACGSSSNSGSAIDKLVSNVDDVIKIVKDNKKDPKAAAAAIVAYTKKNSAKIMDLQASMKKKVATMDKMEVGKKFAPYFTKLMELMKMSTELMKDPEFAKAMTSFNAIGSDK